MPKHKKRAVIFRLHSFKYLLLNSLFGAVITLSLAACSHTVSVRSEPAGATLFPIDSKGSRGAPLGVTPASLKLDRDRDYVALEIKKDGFEATTIVVPLIEASSVTLGVKLKPIDDAWFRERFQKHQARILSTQFMELLKLQNAILQRNDAEVERLSQNMKQDFAQISAWHSMLGNFHFLKGDRNRALSFYKKAFELDPDNAEARGMLQTLQKKGG